MSDVPKLRSDSIENTLMIMLWVLLEPKQKKKNIREDHFLPSLTSLINIGISISLPRGYHTWVISLYIHSYLFGVYASSMIRGLRQIAIYRVLSRVWVHMTISRSKAQILLSVRSKIHSMDESRNMNISSEKSILLFSHFRDLPLFQKSETQNKNYN